jgi:hypothetical protein
MPGEYVLIAITDDGQGMPKEVIERAFEPFYTTKEVGKGSGLGLSMVYGFVKQSNGHVAIYSEPDLGTTVRIYLPQVASKLPQSPEQILVGTGTLPHGTETVLVVEDDPFVRSYSIKSVESLGYSVISAVDGNDALQKLRAENPVDILFTDIVMPGGIRSLDRRYLHAWNGRPGNHEDCPSTTAGPPDHRDLRPPDPFRFQRRTGFSRDGDQAGSHQEPAKADANAVLSSLSVETSPAAVPNVMLVAVPPPVAAILRV